jgi:hypothetical protein
LPHVVAPIEPASWQLQVAGEFGGGAIYLPTDFIACSWE